MVFFSSTFPEQLSDNERVKDVCQRIRNGAYTVPQSNDKKPSRQKGIVDHYHQVVYCDIGKTGSTSWYSVFSSIIKREQHSRLTFVPKHISVSFVIIPHIIMFGFYSDSLLCISYQM